MRVEGVRRLQDHEAVKESRNAGIVRINPEQCQTSSQTDHVDTHDYEQSSKR